MSICDQHNPNPIPEDLIHEITRRLTAEINPARIFIFGSRAWGRSTEDSDLDLMVIMPGCERPTRTLKQRARRCLREFRVPMDIIIESAALFERRSRVRASLERQILERGIKVHG